MNIEEIKQLAKEQNISPLDVLKSNIILEITMEMGEVFLTSDYSWLNDTSLTDKIDLIFLFEALLTNDNLYQHCHLLKELIQKDETYLLILITYENIDYSKLTELRDIIDTFSLKFIKQLLSTIFHHDPQALLLFEEAFTNDNYLSTYFLDKLEDFKNEVNITTFLDFLDNIPLSFASHFIISPRNIYNLFRKSNIDEAKIFINHKFTQKLNYISLDKILCQFYHKDFNHTIFKDYNNPVLLKWFKEKLIKNDWADIQLEKPIFNQFLTIITGITLPNALVLDFYKSKVNSKYIINHPEYIEYFQKIDIDILYKEVLVGITKEDKLDNDNGLINLITFIKERFNSIAYEILLEYGTALENISVRILRKERSLSNINTKEDLLNYLDRLLYEDIIHYNQATYYHANMPMHFKNNYPHLFLSDDTPQDIQKKYYNNKLKWQDFKEHPEWLQYFQNTNISLGFNIPFNDLSGLSKANSIEEENKNKLILLEKLDKINNNYIRNILINYFRENYATICLDTLLIKTDAIANLGYSKLDEDNNYHKEIIKILVQEIMNIDDSQEALEKILNPAIAIINKIVFSNSKEITSHALEVIMNVLSSSNPFDEINRINEIFLTDNLPHLGLLYKTFEQLFPTLDDDKLLAHETLSPVLYNLTEQKRRITIFADLVKITLGSNNKSIKDFLEMLEMGNKLFILITTEKITYEELEKEKQNILNKFCESLTVLYNNTQKGLKQEKLYLSGNLIQDITNLKKLFSPNGTMDYNLPDRIIKMFFHFAGFDTLDEVKKYMQEKIACTDARNREKVLSPFQIEKGDYIKGIRDIAYLPFILQNGVLANEYVGENAKSDFTPLDTDFAKAIEQPEDIDDAIRNGSASEYGPIWILLKNDDRFTITRNHKDRENLKPDNSKKIEVFYSNRTHSDHYDIRTGIASSEIDAIIVYEYNPCIGLEIAINGFYIPVYDFDYKLVFTPKDYDLIRARMQGLKQYNEEKYTISENLYFQGINEIISVMELKEQAIKSKREIIVDKIKNAIKSLNLTLETSLSNNLYPGTVELIENSPTNRETSIDKNISFEFYMYVDNLNLINKDRKKELYNAIFQEFGIECPKYIVYKDNLEFKNVLIGKELTNINIHFYPKSNKLKYPEEMAIKDFLAAIRKESYEKYKLVLANIIEAKRVLKKAKLYNPYSESLYGITDNFIENWILQHGGSFYEATKSFLAYELKYSYKDFPGHYFVWNFGEIVKDIHQGTYFRENFIDNIEYDIVEQMENALYEYSQNQGWSFEFYPQRKRKKQ